MLTAPLPLALCPIQATVQATPKNSETLQDTSVDDIAVIASKIGQLRTSTNFKSVDGMQGVRGSIPLTSTQGGQALRSTLYAPLSKRHKNDRSPKGKCPVDHATGAGSEEARQGVLAAGRASRHQ